MGREGRGQCPGPSSDPSGQSQIPSHSCMAPTQVPSTQDTSPGVQFTCPAARERRSRSQSTAPYSTWDTPPHTHTHSHTHRRQLPSGSLDWGRGKQAGWHSQDGPCGRGCLAHWSPDGDHPPRQDSSSAASGQSGCPSQSRAGGRHRPSAQASQYWGHGQPCSSVPSPQSSCPSQSWARGRQRPELQDSCPSPQPGVAQPGVGRAGRLRPLAESQRSPPPPRKTRTPCPQVTAAGNGRGSFRVTGHTRQLRTQGLTHPLATATRR